VTKTEATLQLKKVEELIVRDEKFLFTALSYIMILIISLNSIFMLSMALGITTSLVFFLVNTIFLEYTLFEEKAVFERLILGSFVLLWLLGIISWAILIIYRLDIIGSAMALCILASLSSTLSRIKTRHTKREPK